MMSTPEEEIATGKSDNNRKGSKWLWVGLGVVLLGGWVAASGGLGDSDPAITPDIDEGSLSVEW